MARAERAISPSYHYKQSVFFCTLRTALEKLIKDSYSQGCRFGEKGKRTLKKTSVTKLCS